MSPYRVVEYDSGPGGIEGRSRQERVGGQRLSLRSGGPEIDLGVAPDLLLKHVHFRFLAISRQG